MLDAQAALLLDKPALRFEGQTTSYAQLASHAQAMAASLHARGLQSGDRVAYVGLNHPLQLALLFACARVGIILMPLNYRLAAAEWQALLQDAQPSLLVSDAMWQEQAKELMQRHALLHELLAQQQDAAPTPGKASSPVLLVYTSGTTGQPKGVLHTQHNLCQNMALAVINTALNATDLVATVLPLFHVGGLCIQTLPALKAGACVSLLSRFEPSAALHQIQRERPTLTLHVPATMRALIQHADWMATDLSSLRAVWAGSSVLPANLIETFHARGIPVCNVYGSTETGPFSICLLPDKSVSHLGSCGWPAGDVVEVKLANEQQDVGEVCIRAPNVAQRYWPDLPLTDSEGWFHTGDLARREPDGSYWIVGRSKDMLISGGENIYPAEIENLLAAIPGIAECAVIGLPDARWGEVAAACVVLQAGSRLNVEELSSALSAQMARYKLPRQWHVLPELPKTALGKVQKEQLKHLILQSHLHSI